MPHLADRVMMTTATTGTGSITLGSAVAGYRSFATAFGNTAQTVGYALTEGTAWEVGTGTFNGTTGLSRDNIRANSNNNSSPISLAGAATVWCDAYAELIEGAGTGMQVAARQGLIYSPFG